MKKLIVLFLIIGFPFTLSGKHSPVVERYVHDAEVFVRHEYGLPTALYNEYGTYPRILVFPHDKEEKCSFRMLLMGADDYGMLDAYMASSEPLKIKAGQVGYPLSLSMSVTLLYDTPDSSCPSIVLQRSQISRIIDVRDESLKLTAIDDGGNQCSGWKKCHTHPVYSDSNVNVVTVHPSGAPVYLYSDRDCKQVRLVIYPFYEKDNAGFGLLCLSSSNGISKVSFDGEELYCYSEYLKQL